MYCAYYNSDFLIGKQCDKSRQYVTLLILIQLYYNININTIILHY